MHQLAWTDLGTAILWGALHAIIPCAHSWPMLIPFAGSSGRAFRAAVLFGLGMVLTALVLGALIGVLARPIQSASRVEEAMGVILVLLGLLFLVRPELVHTRHVHGGGGSVAETSCDHLGHAPRGLLRFGTGLGLFLLGGFNLITPCLTTAPALALAFKASGEGALPSIAVMGLFGTMAALTMGIILHLVGRGIGVLKRLDASTMNRYALRFSGLLLIALGLSLVFHWHEHAHPE